MSEQVTKRKPGRPRIELDRKQIEDLASIGCTISEIAFIKAQLKAATHKNDIKKTTAFIS